MIFRRFAFRLAGPFRRLNQDESGTTLLLFTLMFTVILGFTAMVTDAGVAYWDRRLLQNGVDGGALAGAVHLPDDTTQALAVGKAYAATNGISAAELAAFSNPTYQTQVTSIYNPNDALTIGAQRDFNFGLRYVIGGGDANVVASATAIVTALAPQNIWPWGITSSLVAGCSTDCVLKYGAGGSTDGNFGALSLGGTGASVYQSNIENGYNGAVPAPTGYSNGLPQWSWSIDTEPGNKAGPTISGVSTLMGWDQSKYCDGGTASCASLYTTPPSDGSSYAPQTSDGTVCFSDIRCPRVGLIPLIQETWGSLNGRSSVTVVGFACFYLAGGSGNPGHYQVSGHFLKYCTAAANSTTTPMYGIPLTSTGLIGVFLFR